MVTEISTQPANAPAAFAATMPAEPIQNVSPEFLPSGTITFRYKGIDTPMATVGFLITVFGTVFAILLAIMR